MHSKADLFTDDLSALAEQAKALSHPARLRILQVLAERDTCICGDLVDELPLAQPSVSRHLKVLRDAGLIQGTIDGPRSCYCLAPDGLARLRETLGAFFAPIGEAAASSCP